MSTATAVNTAGTIGSIQGTGRTVTQGTGAETAAKEQEVRLSERDRIRREQCLNDTMWKVILKIGTPLALYQLLTQVFSVIDTMIASQISAESVSAVSFLTQIDVIPPASNRMATSRPDAPLVSLALSSNALTKLTNPACDHTNTARTIDRMPETSLHAFIMLSSLNSLFFGVFISNTLNRTEWVQKNTKIFSEGPFSSKMACRVWDRVPAGSYSIKLA